MSLWPDTAAKMLNEQHDIYEKAREEYRKKISEQAARIERLEAALRALHDEMDEYQRINNLSAYNNHVMRQARAALGEKA